MKIELKTIVALTDEICLSYDRGSTCREIIDTAKVVLSCHNGINISIIEAVNSDLIETNEFHQDKQDYFSNIETCGLRMYQVLRKMFTNDKNESFEVLKLRLFAVRCLHVGFVNKSTNFKALLNDTETNYDNYEYKEAIQRSVVEISRAYIRTSFKFSQIKTKESKQLELGCLK